MVGSTVGRYRIQEVLGEGGMGVVYKAEDTKLRRPVALKFLNRAAVQDEESRRRFLQEAQAAAALDHPNICGVFEIDEHDGGWYIAMPFLEGRDLENRIAAGPLAYSDIVEIGRQMADGLEEAHAKGIVHRDIKPANVSIGERARGRLQVKLMDFGLARLANATRLTRDGRQMGTAAYMSPEQVMGSPVDQRTDIWALGVVMYEMTVGAPPFPSDYEQALFYGIQNEDPEPLTAMRTGVPMELERIVTKCLAKEPNERYQSCTDLLIDLKALARELDEGRSGAVGRSAMPTQPADPPPGDVQSSPPEESTDEQPPIAERAAGRRSALGLVVIGALAGAAAVWIWGASSESSPDSRIAPNYELNRVTWDGDLNLSPTLSPDGTLLAYCSDRAGRGNLDLWVQQVDGGGLIRISDDPADETDAVFSPDGKQIAFTRGSEGVFTIPAIGGDPYLVAAGAQHPRFSPDGSKISFVKSGRSGGVFYAPISMGDPVQLLDGFTQAGVPLWSPDGEALLVWGRSASGELDWWSAPINGDQPEALGAAKVFKDAGMGLPAEGWARNGRQILFMSQDDAELYSVTLAEDGRSISAPVRLTTGGAVEYMPTMSDSGLIAIADIRQRRDVWALPIDRRTGLASAEMERITSTEASDTAGDVAADGSRMVYVSNRWGRRDIWTKDLTTGEEANASSDAAEQQSPLLSPDGQQIAYLVRTGDQSTIYLRPFAGGAGRTLCEDCGAPKAWTPDGRRLLYGRNGGIHVLDIATKRSTLVAGSDEAPIRDAALSRDGLWLAFRADRDYAGIWTASFAKPELIDPASWTRIVDDPEAQSPVWGPDGTRLYYTSRRGRSRDLWMSPLDGAKKAAGEPQLIRRFETLRHSLDLMALNDRRLTIGADRLFFPMSEISGHIWLMSPR